MPPLPYGGLMLAYRVGLKAFHRSTSSCGPKVRQFLLSSASVNDFWFRLGIRCWRRFWIEGVYSHNRLEFTRLSMIGYPRLLLDLVALHFNAMVKEGNEAFWFLTTKTTSTDNLPSLIVYSYQEQRGKGLSLPHSILAGRPSHPLPLKPHANRSAGGIHIPTRRVVLL